MRFSKLSYPATLTQTAWKQLADLLGQTESLRRLGEACSETERAFGLVPWERLDPTQVLNSDSFQAGNIGPQQAAIAVYNALRETYIAPIASSLALVIDLCTIVMKDDNSHASIVTAVASMHADAQALKKTLESQKFWNKLIYATIDAWDEQKNNKTVKYGLRARQKLE